MSVLTVTLQRLRPFIVKAFIAAFLLGAVVVSQAQSSQIENTLMPQPTQLLATNGSLPISEALTISVSASDNPLLHDAAIRFLDRLEAQTGVQLRRDLQSDGAALIEVRVQDTTTMRPALGVDESYSLDVQNGKIILKSQTVFGAMHGFETLLQLVQVQNNGFVVPYVRIVDAPRFPWRGLLLDPARHFLSVEEILRTLDGMAAVKMNVLHWHLTDDQGFRIESRRFPRLHEFGSEGYYYTQQQVHEIVQYATARGIRVVPEFDMPGHSLSWMVGYPELGSQPGPYQVSHENQIADAVMDPTRKSTYKFLDSFLGEMTTLFPDEYVHIGGDECKGKEWRENEQIIRFMKQHGFKNTNSLQAYFNTRLQAILEKHGKQMIGWDEILQPNLSSNVVVQSWHGAEFLVNAAQHGHKGLLSKPYYLDQMYSTAEMYLADPIPAGAKLQPAEVKLILGGEACMWGEQVNTITVDSRIWPATAAIAERFWSPSEVRDVNDMYRRLTVMSLRLDGIGLTHISSPQRGLRQLAGSEAGAGELAVLASVLQPVSFEEREGEQHTASFTPLEHFVDFTRPDPPARHRIQVLTGEYLQSTDPTKHEECKQNLEAIFRSWIATQPALDQLAVTHPFVAEMKIRREQLPRLGLIGIQAMDAIETRHKPSAEWLDAQRMLLKEAGQHLELTDFVVIEPLDSLLRRAAQP